MPLMHRASHDTSLSRPLLLLVLAGALAACGDEPPEPEPGLLLFDRFSHDFGQVHAGERSGEQVFTARNAGAGALDGLRVRLEPGDDFEVVGTTCAGRLEPSQTCTVTVAFTPTRGGGIAAELVVEADRAQASAAIGGVGAVTVQVVNNVAARAVVESRPAGIRCGTTCEATFTEAEIVLSVADAGIAVWPEQCEVTAEGDCLLALSGDAVISLDDIIGLQWTFGSGRPGAVAIDAGNNVIAAEIDAPSLFKLSPAGALLWQKDDLFGGLAVAVDAQGNIGFASDDGRVRKLDGDGNLQWARDSDQTGITDPFHVAFDGAGALYIAGTLGGGADSVGVLAKLDADGNFQWSQTHGDYVTDLVVDGAGNAFIVAREAADPAQGGPDPAFLRKVERDGRRAWELEGLGGELAVDAAGNLFVDGEPGIRKYAPDGQLLWEAFPEAPISGFADVAVTPTGDLVAAGTGFEGDTPTSIVVVSFDGASGTPRPLVELPTEQAFFGRVAVDGNGDLVFVAGDFGFGVRKYDGALFDHPSE